MAEIRLLDLNEAAEVLKCSPITVRRRVISGMWPCTRPTTKIQFTEANIAEILELSAQPAKPAARTSPARPRKAS